MNCNRLAPVRLQIPLLQILQVINNMRRLEGWEVFEEDGNDRVVLCATFSSERRVLSQLLHSPSAPVPTSSCWTTEFNEVEHEMRESIHCHGNTRPSTRYHGNGNDHASPNKNLPLSFSASPDLLPATWSDLL